MWLSVCLGGSFGWSTQLSTAINRHYKPHAGRLVRRQFPALLRLRSRPQRQQHKRQTQWQCSTVTRTSWTCKEQRWSGQLPAPRNQASDVIAPHHGHVVPGFYWLVVDERDTQSSSDRLALFD